ncbi:MAG: glycosyltransferase family 4 protein, partial [Anaerolineales bacterium]|nr:glycosyltransferase family 4 protein [Anaerolineales bacterium]
NDRLQIAQEVYREIKKRSISDMIRWFSSLPYENIARMYDLVRGSGGIVISTSRNESFGLSVVEAMARGCVVFAPNQGPFTEYLISGINGYIYNRRDLDTTVSCIPRVFNDHELRDQIGTRSRADMARLFHPDATSKNLMNELQEIY